MRRRAGSAGGEPEEGETWRDFLRCTAEETTPALPPNISLPPYSEYDGASPGPSANFTPSTQPPPPSPKRGPFTLSNAARQPSQSLDGTEETQEANRPDTAESSSTVASPPSSSGNATSQGDFPLIASQVPRSLSQSLRSNRYGQETLHPRWQPDEEVDLCTVCHRPFSILLRRHHCRKCGKVVCAFCSVHKIRMMRMCVARPPGAPTPPALLDEPSGLEEVRVCNPCVPDPNVEPPPQYSPLDEPAHFREWPRNQNTRDSFDEHMLDQAIRAGYGNHLHGHIAAFATSTQPPSHGTGPWAFSTPLRDPHADLTDPTTQHPSSAPPPRGFSVSQPASSLPPAYSSNAYTPSPVQPTLQPRQSNTFRNRSSTTGTASFVPRSPGNPYPQSPHLSGPNTMFLSNASGTAGQIVPPRRHIHENDACPVCRRELPPSNPSNDDAARAQHIMTCIERVDQQRSAASAQHRQQRHSSSTAGAALPPPRTSSAQNGLTSRHAHSSSSASESPRPTPLLTWTATEKDCIDASSPGGPGTLPHECVICLEEFEPGQELGRMECFCKFHRRCVEGWWRKRGERRCPTHALGIV